MGAVPQTLCHGDLLQTGTQIAYDGRGLIQSADGPATAVPERHTDVKAR
jgi:hypothetical protein